MSDLDLHQLANEGGYGVAKNAVKAAGYWDEFPEMGELKTFQVRVGYTKTVEDWMVLDIEAITKEQALQLATEEALKYGDGTDDIDAVEEVTIEQPSRISL